MRKIYNKVMSKFVKAKLYYNTYVCLTDNTHLEIENCKRVLEYSDVFLKIKTSTLTLCIYGENLTISDYNTDGIIVNGKFSSIEFE